MEDGEVDIVLSVIGLGDASGNYGLRIGSMTAHWAKPEMAGQMLGRIAWLLALEHPEDARDVILTKLLSAWHREKMTYHTRRADEIACKWVIEEAEAQIREAKAQIKEAEAA